MTCRRLTLVVMVVEETVGWGGVGNPSPLRYL